MEDRWEKFANKNAKYYVDTSFSKDKESKKSFFESGRIFTKKALASVDNYLPDKECALEIGAGIGRLTLPHANHFEKIIAVDVAPSMLKKLKANAERVNQQNIRLFLPGEKWDAHSISYAYSYLVFQHITDINIIIDYINRIAGCLKNGGVAQLQFDTRGENMAYKLRNHLPDILLPKNQREGIRRVRRDAKHLRSIFKMNELSIIREKAAGTAVHHFILRK